MGLTQSARSCSRAGSRCRCSIGMEAWVQISVQMDMTRSRSGVGARRPPRFLETLRDLDTQETGTGSLVAVFGTVATCASTRTMVPAMPNLTLSASRRRCSISMEAWVQISAQTDTTRSCSGVGARRPPRFLETLRDLDTQEIGTGSLV